MIIPSYRCKVFIYLIIIYNIEESEFDELDYLKFKESLLEYLKIIKAIKQPVLRLATAYQYLSAILNDTRITQDDKQDFYMTIMGQILAIEMLAGLNARFIVKNTVKGRIEQ